MGKRKSPPNESQSDIKKTRGTNIQSIPNNAGAIAACDREREAHSHRPNNSAVVDLCNMNDLTPSRYRFGIIRRRFDVEHPIESNTHPVVELCNPNCASPPRLRPGILRRRCNEERVNELDMHPDRPKTPGITIEKSTPSVRIVKQAIGTKEASVFPQTNDDVLHYTEEEIEALDQAGISKPVSSVDIERIMGDFYDAYHDRGCVCAVCDQFCTHSETINLNPKHMKPDFLKPLMAPLEENCDVPSLHGDLIRQYDISQFFDEEVRQSLYNILLSPRGIVRQQESNSCEFHLIFCGDCLRALNQKRLPKFAIANGNWFGQLPEEIREMSYGTLSLLRPIQTFGRIVEYHGRGSTKYGSRLTGHMYSTKLDTPLIRNKVPLKPIDAPVRVVVLSPFTSNETAAKKAKIAITKADYIVEPEKISGVLHFWKKVRNPHMAAITIDTETLQELPSGDVSGDVFSIHSAEPLQTDSSDIEVIDKEKETDGDGGSCLDKSYEETADAILLSSTATVGGTAFSEDNPYREVADVLCNDPLIQVAGNSKNTYVVRSSNDFAGEDDPCYLEKCYPDLLPFGRGGYGEIRKIPISKQALLRYMLNLSTRQFQHVDFVFPNYDMLTRKCMFNKAMASTKLPSRALDSNGQSLNKGEVFGRISAIDIQKAAEFKRKCAAAAALGKRMPPLPTSVSGLAVEFFTQLKAISSPMQHSQAAAARNRLVMFAALNNLGKPDLWLTYCPKDSCCFEISWYALGEEAKEKFGDQVPPIEYRLSLTGNRPVAAALHFDRVLKLFVQKVIGWDLDKQLPFKSGGIFGVPKAFVRAVEEQGHLTLHVHCLLWLAGHRNIHTQIERCNEENMRGNDTPFPVPYHANSPTNISNETTSSKSTKKNVSPVEVVNVSTESKGTAKRNEIASQLAENIASFCSAELSLPETEKKLVGKCIKQGCDGVLQLTEKKEILEKMRKRISIDAEEISCLSCSVCVSSFTCSEAVSALLEHGYQRCYGRSKLTNDEVESLIWRGLPKKPQTDDSLERDRWLLNLASVEAAVNIHDWRHRASCFKNGGSVCRYCIPYIPHSSTEVLPMFHTSSQDGDTVLNSHSVEKLNLFLRRRVPFLFVTEFNEPIMSVLNCNNCVRYVEDQKIGYYLGLYTTKHGTDNEKILADTMRSLTAYEKRNQAMLQENMTNRSAFSVGMGRLLSAARGATNGETIGGPMAAFCLSGNVIFLASHKTVPLLIDQAEASLTGDSITACINRNGSVHATINDYRFRNTELHIENLSYWEFLTSQELCKRWDLRNDRKLQASRERRHDFGKSVDKEPSHSLLVETKDNERNIYEETLSEMSTDDESDERTEKQKEISKDDGKQNHYLFIPAHPLYQTHGHRKRKRKVWPQFWGLKLPNVHQLEDDSNLPVDERNENRETYGKSVLLMFRPFRTLNDLRYINETWWNAYLRQKEIILTNKTAKAVLENMQNFYESIVQNGDKTESMRISKMANTSSDEGGEYNADDETDDDIENVTDLTSEDPESSCLTKKERPLDPFVQKMSTYSQNPLQLNPKILGTDITIKSALDAISQLKVTKNSLSSLTTLSSDKDGSNGSTSMSGSLTLNESIPTRVDLAQLIFEALQATTHFENATVDTLSTENAPQQSTNTSNQWFPTLQQHSRKWRLNKKQHAAFLLSGAAFLQHLYKTAESTCTQPSEGASQIDLKLRCELKKLLPVGEQLLLHLSGSGGTGKSRVLQALVEFSKRWKSPESIMVTASCGGAAVLIGGSTLHSALGITPGLNHPPPTEMMRAAWSRVGVLFIDEFSMVSPSFLTLLDKRLRQLKVRPDVPFGGIHVIFCGDFFQLPPVGAPTIYTSSTESLRSDTRTALYNWSGKELWNTCLTDVVELTESHRFADEKWAAALERWRINQPTKEDIADVNSRFMPCTSSSAMPANTIIAVPENNAREQGIRFAEQELLARLGPITETTSSWEKRGILLIQASLTTTSKKFYVQPSQCEEDKIRNLDDKRLKVVGNLYCILGNIYVVGKNESVVSGIANGTQAHLQSIVLKKTARIRVVHLGGDKQVHAVYADEVYCLIFRHTSTSWASAATFPTLPLGAFPITQISQNICWRIGSEKKMCSFRVRQFPCANALIMTGHKVQGLTTDSIALGDISKHHQYGSTGWLYVILSRVRTLQGLTTLTRLTEDPRKFKARKHVIAEMERLRNIEQNTLRRLQMQWPEYQHPMNFKGNCFLESPSATVAVC